MKLFWLKLLLFKEPDEQVQRIGAEEEGFTLDPSLAIASSTHTGGQWRRPFFAVRAMLFIKNQLYATLLNERNESFG